MSHTITVTDILAALDAAQAGTRDPDVPPLTYSGTDIREAMRWGHTMFTRTMRGWIADGTCRVVTVRKQGIDGRMCHVKGYQFVKPVAAPKPSRKKAA